MWKYKKKILKFFCKISLHFYDISVELDHLKTDRRKNEIPMKLVEKCKYCGKIRCYAQGALIERKN